MGKIDDLTKHIKSNEIKGELKQDIKGVGANGIKISSKDDKKEESKFKMGDEVSSKSRQMAKSRNEVTSIHHEVTKTAIREASIQKRKMDAENRNAMSLTTSTHSDKQQEDAPDEEKKKDKTEKTESDIHKYERFKDANEKNKKFRNRNAEVEKDSPDEEQEIFNKREKEKESGINNEKAQEKRHLEKMDNKTDGLDKSEIEKSEYKKLQERKHEDKKREDIKKEKEKREIKEQKKSDNIEDIKNGGKGKDRLAKEKVNDGSASKLNKKPSNNTAGDKLADAGKGTEKINNGKSLSKLRGIADNPANAGVQNSVKVVTKPVTQSGAGTGQGATAKAGTEAGAGAKTGAATKAGTEAGKKAIEKFAETGSKLLGEIVLVIAIVLLAFALVVVIADMLLFFGKTIATNKSSTSKSSSGSSEQKILWNTLMKHFDDNEIATLGIMCNIKYESGFKANNLEDQNNERWNISDTEYTDMLNDESISKDEFCRSSYNGSTTGYNNGLGWVNCDGGYGYCQYTSYEKKSSLYDYATDWFSDTGKGKGKDFNIANPTMQANYIVYLLEHDFKSIDTKLKNATSVYDAVYIWVSEYEIPAGSLSDIASLREKDADSIKSKCMGGGSNSGDFAEMDGTYFVQEGSGPCGTCSTANLIKRYCYLNGDTDWDEITPDLITDEGYTMDEAVCGSSVGSSVGFFAFDSSGDLHRDTDCCEYPLQENTVMIHGITCHWKTVDASLTDEDLMGLLDEHPEGVAACGIYYRNGEERGHIKLISSYTEDENGNIVFYCADPGSWGGTKDNGYPDSNCDGRYEKPLESSSCWFDASAISWYRYMAED